MAERRRDPFICWWTQVQNVCSYDFDHTYVKWQQMLWNCFYFLKKKKSKLSIISYGHLCNFLVKPEESSGIPSFLFVQKVMPNLTVLLVSLESRVCFLSDSDVFLDVSWLGLLLQDTFLGQLAGLSCSFCVPSSFLCKPSAWVARSLHRQNLLTWHVVILKC